jgi:thiamine transporter ThiT
MADHASDHHRGEMDIREQVSTFDLFMGMTKWGSLYIAALLTMLTLWFCTDAGFLGGLIPGIVLIVLGTVLLAKKKPAAH